MGNNRSGISGIGMLILLAFFGMLASFAFANEPTDPKVTVSATSPNTVVLSGQVTWPQFRVESVEVGDPDEGPTWDDIRRHRIQDAIDAALLRINFDFDKDDLDAEANAAVVTLVTILTENPEVNLRLSGHTDLMGSVEYNMDLSFRRAERVRRALIDCGVDGARLQASFHGKSKPLINEVRKERTNRRVEAEAFDTKPNTLNNW
mgnify:CR=1 FL=1